MKVKLGDICNINMGQSPDSSTYNKENDGLPFFQGNADFGEINPIAKTWCSKPIKIADKNDILISVRAPIGALNIAKEKSCIGRGLAAIKADETICLQKYLKYILESKKDILVSKGTGSTFKAISKNTLAELKFTIPSLKTQHQHIEILDKLNNLINLRKKQCQALDLMVKSKFIEMFGDVMLNEKNWLRKPLGELCYISRGGSPRPIDKFLGGNVPWIKIGDATNDDNIYLTSTKEYIISDGVKKSHLVKPGSLIFANCGVSLGFARILTFEGCIHDGWLSFEDVDESLDKVFLLLTLNFMTKYFRNIAPAGTQPNLNTSIMKQHLQIIPPIKMQRQYVSFVCHADKSKFTS